MAGLWSTPEVPHKGWSCIDIEDLGEPSESCEMCGEQTIRYVHVMTHPRYHGVDRAGCVCAGHMEENPAAAEERERNARNEAARRARWLTRDWRISARGNQFLNVRGDNVAIYQKKGTVGPDLSRTARPVDMFTRNGTMGPKQQPRSPRSTPS